MLMQILLNPIIWITSTIFLGLFVIGMAIFYYLLFKRTHVYDELHAFFTNTPIGIFFQDNKFAEWKPITPLNGVVYDMDYGPFLVTTTYVDKKTKNIFIPFDVDMDGDRTSNFQDLVDEFRYISNNEKSIADLRTAISSEMMVDNKNIENLTSSIKFGILKTLFYSTAPHNIKSKIEKLVSEKIVKMSNVNFMQAIIVFGAIFGIIVIAAILLKTVGGA